ncbi:MAG: hypothetical protein AAF845_18180 [Bacteroidota bacterium]
MTPDAFPLSWPLGRPRTKRPKRSQFKSSMADARDGLFDELRRLGARDVVVSTNIETYERGGRRVPYANQTVGDPGAAVYFTKKGNQFAFACDRWDRVGDNLHAIARAARWGGIDRRTIERKRDGAVPVTGWDVGAIEQFALADRSSRD